MLSFLPKLVAAFIRPGSLVGSLYSSPSLISALPCSNTDLPASLNFLIAYAPSAVDVDEPRDTSAYVWDTFANVYAWDERIEAEARARAEEERRTIALEKAERYRVGSYCLVYPGDDRFRRTRDGRVRWRNSIESRSVYKKEIVQQIETRQFIIECNREDALAKLCGPPPTRETNDRQIVDMDLFRLIVEAQTGRSLSDGLPQFQTWDDFYATLPPAPQTVAELEQEDGEAGHVSVWTI